MTELKNILEQESKKGVTEKEYLRCEEPVEAHWGARGGVGETVQYTLVGLEPNF